MLNFCKAEILLFSREYFIEYFINIPSLSLEAKVTPQPQTKDS
jgi:hypothetical protein